MGRRALQIALVTVFGVVMAHAAFRAWGPMTSPEYVIKGDGKALMGPESDGVHGKFLYLRRTMYLPKRPTQMWIEVAGYDDLVVYVNGQLVSFCDARHYWAPSGLSLDISPYVGVGRNAIGIAAVQKVALRPPIVSVRGGYVIDNREFFFGNEDGWLAAHAFDRGRSWWFQTDFDDRNWRRAKVVPAQLRAAVLTPPRAASTPRTANWITPVRWRGTAAAVRRDFELAGRPTSGWLRVTALSSYRLAVNGMLIDAQDAPLSLPRPDVTVRTYDISPALRRGHNSVAFQMITDGMRPHLLCDMEIADGQGKILDLGSGPSWLARGDLSTDWFKLQVDDPAWQPAQAGAGDMGLNAFIFPHEIVEIRWPDLMTGRRFIYEAVLATVIGLITLMACGLISRMLVARRADPLTAPSTAQLAYLALILPTLVTIVATVATYDPRFAWQELLSTPWIIAALASVPLQWLLLMFFSSRRERSPAGTALAEQASSRKKLRLSYAAMMLLLLMIPGTWLRTRHLLVEPIHHDEVSAFWFTQGILDTGFPGGQPRMDIPFGYAATSELTYYPAAFLSLFIKDPILMLRLPSLFFSLATIPLLFLVGSRLFSPAVGLVAAAIYTFAPYQVEMSNFGRYFAQLQFFAVLVIYFFWRTVEGKGRIDAKMLWLTGISFLLMYYSWEGSGFLALGLILAALVQRRGHMWTILGRPTVWLAMLTMLLAFFIQDDHRIFQQTQRLWWGFGISNLEIYPMWRYPLFTPSFYFCQLSWIADSMLPVVLMGLALLIAVRHPWKDPLRVMLVTVLGTTGLMTAMLPLRAGRYVYHLTPLAILIASVTIVVVARALARSINQVRMPRWSVNYARLIGGSVAAAAIAVACGSTLQLTDLHYNASLGYRYNDLKFPHWEEPLRYLRDHFQEGDIVIAVFPHLVDHSMYFANDNRIPRGWLTDYWLQTSLVLQATLDDVRDNPLDRRAGTPMIASMDELKNMFASNRRIWYLYSSGVNNGLNETLVSEYLRKNMSVVYEDFNASLMVRDANHRPSSLEIRDDVNLRYGQANFLP